MLLWKKSGAKVDRLAHQLNITRLSWDFHKYDFQHLLVDCLQ